MASLLDSEYQDISGDGGVLKLTTRAAVTKVVQQTNPEFEKWQELRQKLAKEDKQQQLLETQIAPPKFIPITLIPEKCVPGTVQVHYTGSLERSGEEFDTSRKFGSAYSAPFKFNVGEGSVVKGFDLAVLSMMTGERAQFKLRSDYAYGDSGLEGDSELMPDILPGDTLVFDLELITVGLQSAKDDRLIKEERRLEEIKAERVQLEIEKKAKKEELIRKKEQATKDRVEKLAMKKNKGRKEKKASKGDGVDRGGSLTKKEVQKMKPKDLKANLKKMGESIQGNKKELIVRLLEKLRL